MKMYLMQILFLIIFIIEILFLQSCFNISDLSYRIITLDTNNFLIQQSIVLIGDTGTGKTTIIKKFSNELEGLINRKLPSLLFEHIYINCRRNRTIYSVLISLIKNFIPEFPTRGFATSEILRMIQDLLGQTQTHVLLILDEINYLVHEPEFQDFLYSLTRLNDEFLSTPHQYISIILISQNRFFLDNL